MNRSKKLPLSEEHLHMLLHSLGIQNRGGKWSTGGWRNHYSTDRGADSFPHCKRLQADGWMEGFDFGADGWTFRVTEAGIAALKLAGWKIEVEP